MERDRSRRNSDRPKCGDHPESPRWLARPVVCCWMDAARARWGRMLWCVPRMQIHRPATDTRRVVQIPAGWCRRSMRRKAGWGGEGRADSWLKLSGGLAAEQVTAGTLFELAGNFAQGSQGGTQFARYGSDIGDSA